MDLSVLWVLLVIFSVTLAWWALVFLHPTARRRFWPSYRFRPTHWVLPEVLGVFVALVLLLSVSHWAWGQLGARRGSRNATKPKDSFGVELSPDEQASQKAHWVIILLKEQPDVATLMLIVATTGFLGPLTEEVIFRLFLQGWLHTQELRWYKQRRTRRRTGTWRSSAGVAREPGGSSDGGTAPHGKAGMRVSYPWPMMFRLPVGSFAVLGSTCVFAALHIRSPHAVPPMEDIRAMLLDRLVAYVAFLAVVLFTLFLRDPLSRYRWGLRRGMLWRDILLGMAWFFATAAPIYGAQFCFSKLVPESMVADPLTMLLVGGILGTLFARTGRIVPSAVFHIALNMTSVILAWWLLV